MKWTDADSAHARAEGWDVFPWHPETQGGYEVRHVPGGIFSDGYHNDGQAVLHVVRKALEGSRLHIKALRIDMDILPSYALDILDPPEPPEPD
jgi:hypothetical protein